MPLGNTTFLQIETIAENDNNKYLLVNDGFQAIDDAINRQITIDTSAGYTLSESEFVGNFVVRCNTHTTAQTLFVPATLGGNSTRRQFVVRNEGTDTLTVDLVGSPGSSVDLAPDEWGYLYATGTNVFLIASSTGGGAITFTDGSAAAPSIVFTDDADTGFFRIGANQIGMTTGGTQRVGLSNTAMQVDVPINGTAVQSNATDTTANRLMAVGAFGLGAANPPTITDFTAALQPGFYDYAENSATGAPGPGSTFSCFAFVGSNGVSNGSFIIAGRGTTNPANQRMWFGTRTSSTGAITWREIFHDSSVFVDSAGATSYSLVEADLVGNVVKKFTNGSPVTVTVTASLTNTQPVTVVQGGAGQVEFVADTGVTINSASGNLKLTGQWSSAVLIPDGSDNYILIGDLAA